MNKILFKIIEGKGKFFLKRRFSPMEIVNPEVLVQSGFCMLDGDGIYFKATDGVAHDFRDNETFSVPEGISFEKVCSKCWSTETDMSDLLCCSTANYQGIRLLPEKPVQKEESQEELSKLTDDIELIISNWFKSGNENWTHLAHLIAELTIKRKRIMKNELSKEDQERIKIASLVYVDPNAFINGAQYEHHIAYITFSFEKWTLITWPCLSTSSSFSSI